METFITFFFIDKLHSVGVFSLKDIGVPGLIPLMEQVWLSVDQLGLDDHQDVAVWNGYLSILKRSHVRLTNDNDVLVWNLSKSCLYTPKKGYVQLLLDRDGMDHSQWWKLLWNLKCPLKEKIFCWFLLSDKALTWDIVIRKGREGPGRCYLCKLNIETNLHLGVECPFTQYVWMNLEDRLKLNNLWYGGTVSDCLKTWCLNMKVNHIKTLPIIVLWNIWKAINVVCFEVVLKTFT